MPNIEYKVVPLRQLKLKILTANEMSERESREAKKAVSGKLVKSIEIDGEQLAPTNRFWQSLYARFNINAAFFRFFEYDEVFERISQQETNDLIRVCIERDPHGHGTLLAATGLNKPVIVYDDLVEILDAFHSESGVKYAGGIVTSTHSPRIGSNAFTIAGDGFSNKFVLHLPIDGYGQPNIFLSLLRLVCSNGAVGFAPTFKTTLALGHGSDSVRTALRRALDAFSNDEGYAILRHRFEIATKSWASLREQQDLYRFLVRLHTDGKLRSGDLQPGQYTGILSDLGDVAASRHAAVLKAFTDMTGDPYEVYHSDPNMMSEKRLRTLPVGCKVYDLLNFATEVATHHVTESTARSLQGWVGQMLSQPDFDLEDSCDQFDIQFKDRFLPRKGEIDEAEFN